MLFAIPTPTGGRYENDFHCCFAFARVSNAFVRETKTSCERKEAIACFDEDRKSR